MKIQKKLLLTAVFLGILIWVVFNLQPPQALDKAAPLQILSFFLPLFLFLFFCLTFFISRVKSFLVTLATLAILYCLGIRLINYLGAVVSLLVCFILINPPQRTFVDKIIGLVKSKNPSPPQDIKRGLKRITKS